MPCKTRRGLYVRRGGFSLIEVMVVIVILGLLAGVVAVNVRGHLERAKHTTALTELATLEEAVDSFYLATGRYPTNQEGLQALVKRSEQLPEPLIKRLPSDPWGQPYQYNSPGREGTPFEVFSLGADGIEGGEGGDADVGTWNLDEQRS